MPLFGDETTYLKLADNILKGKYYLTNNPSTVTPIIPFVIAFFKINAYPMLGFALAKISHIILTVFGFRYLYLFLKKQQINHRIILAIIALTAVNPIAISNFGSLYPEAILFFCFWGVIYYSVSEYTISNFVKMFFLFLMLSMTRYLYLVLGLIVVFNFYNYYRSNSTQNTFKVGIYSAILMIPILFWAKYVYNIEQNNLSEISYFHRFKTDNQFLYNIKSGLGIIKHHEVSRINGIPAFISLFVPITGLRHYLLSIVLLLTISFGYFRKENSTGIKILISALLLPMLGLVFAGTGFSRYWLILLPGFILGFYFAANKLGITNKVFIYISQIVCFIYIVNEIRLDLLIINKHL